MIRLIVFLAAFSSAQAFAHVSKGEYKGHDLAGKACSFKVGETWFADEIEHPLTERIEITKIAFFKFSPELNQFQAGHPPVVNVESGLVRFNHDIFQDVTPSFTGAVSVTLLKGKEESGTPVGIIYIEDNYKVASKSKKMTCLL